MNDYQEFLAAKPALASPVGIDVKDSQLNQRLFDWQRHVLRYLLKLGKSGAYLECGLGKTGISLSWAEQIVRHTNGKVLILTPLTVGHQFVSEGENFDIECVQVRSQAEADKSKCAIVVTNYEMLKNFDTSQYQGVYLDESDILANYTGKLKRRKYVGIELKRSYYETSIDYLSKVANESQLSLLDLMAV